MLKIFGGKGKRKKRKKYDEYEEYDEYEDDEYEDDEYEDDEYEDDEYEDDEYEDDEYEDDEPNGYSAKRKNKDRSQKKIKQATLGKKREQSVGRSRDERKEDLDRKIQFLEQAAKENSQKIAQLESNLESAQLTNQSLENELSMVQALPKDYEAKISELAQLKTNYNELLMDKKQQSDRTDLTFYRKKAERLAAKVHQYEQELLVKQEEIDRLLEFNTNVSFNDAGPDVLVYEELEKVRQELAYAKRQLELKERENEQYLTKEDIGEVLLGAKQQAKKIVHTANKKAEFISNETQKKTEVLKRLELAEQEYRNYYKRIKDVKEESEQAFNQIMSLVRDGSQESDNALN